MYSNSRRACRTFVRALVAMGVAVCALSCAPNQRSVRCVRPTIARVLPAIRGQVTRPTQMCGYMGARAGARAVRVRVARALVFPASASAGVQVHFRRSCPRSGDGHVRHPECPCIAHHELWSPAFALDVSSRRRRTRGVPSCCCRALGPVQACARGWRTGRGSLRVLSFGASGTRLANWFVART